MKNILTCCVVFLSLLSFSQQTWTSDNLPATGTSPDVVYLRHDCGTMPDCGESMGDLLDWIWNTRQPTALNPLLVDIGAGTFNIGATWTDFWVRPNGAIRRSANAKIFCDNAGHVTFRGAGRGNTILTGKGIGTPPADFQVDLPVLTVKNCDNLAFQDMDIVDHTMVTAGEPGVVDSTGAGGHGIIWWGGGSSTWSNVGVLAAGYGWLDTCSGGGVPGEHKWFGSSVQSGPAGYYNVAYRSDCGVNEFFGGDIQAVKSDISQSFSLVGVQTGHANGSVAIYGALVRAILPETAVSSSGYSNQHASSLQSGHGGLHAKAGTIHMHGGIVSVRAEVSGVDSEVFGAKASLAGTIHAPDTAFGLKPGGAGEAQRVIGASVKAPYQWPSDVTPPSITSLTGSDTFVETDCDSDGDCSGNGTDLHPHMMIYDASCNGGTDPWFDVVTGACRQ